MDVNKLAGQRLHTLNYNVYELTMLHHQPGTHRTPYTVLGLSKSGSKELDCR